MNFSRINGYENPATINGMLQSISLLTNGSVKVFDKEVAFKSEFSRNAYCQDLHNRGIHDHNPWEYATSSQMTKSINRDGTLFLTSCRETTANSLTHAAFLKHDDIDVIAEKNKNNMLPWHSGVIYYKQGILYYFEPRLQIESEEFKSRTITFKFRARIIDFIDNNQGIAIYKIFIGGDNVRGNCRKKSLEFIANIVNSQKSGQACKKYLFYEFKKGPRKPKINELMVLDSIPLV